MMIAVFIQFACVLAMTVMMQIMSKRLRKCQNENINLKRVIDEKEAELDKMDLDAPTYYFLDKLSPYSYGVSAYKRIPIGGHSYRHHSILVKSFTDCDDPDFAKRQAEELVEKLNEI